MRILDDNLLPFDKVFINRVSTTQDRPDDIFLDLREAKTGASALVGEGLFHGHLRRDVVPGIALHAEFQRGRRRLQSVIAGKKIEGLALGGDDANVTIDMYDSFAKLKVEALFCGLDVAYPPIVLGVGFHLASTVRP